MNISEVHIMKKVIENVRFVQDGTLVFGDIHLEDGFVERIDYKTLQMQSDYAICGFIDIHTHGFRGISSDDLHVDNLRSLALEYAKRGTVGFCASITARSFEEYEAIINVYKEAFQDDYKGARFLGLHLEGPFLNEQHAGSQKDDLIQKVDVHALDMFLKKYHDIIAIMTIAPELEHALEAIKVLHRYGVIISLGYSNASYDIVSQAIDAGAKHITHLSNNMPDINHKRPGLMDSAFTTDIKCELNVDGVHINKVMLSWLLSVIGTDRIMVVSDGGKYCGFEYPDEFALEDGYIVRNRAVYKDDILYSSTKDMLDAFQYLKKEAGYDLLDCIKLTSGNAAKELHTMGCEIGLGKRVNLVLLDHNMEIKDVVINGKSVL